MVHDNLQTSLYSITPKHHIIEINCLNFMKKNQPWIGISWRTRWGNVAFNYSKDREKDSGIRIESKKIFSSALKTAPEVTRF